MTNRNRRGFARIGMLAIALLLALGAMGVAYSAWTDDIYIEGTLSTGDINAGLQCGTCWEEPDNPDTDIDCTGGSMTLTFEVSNAQLETDYYGNFIVSNAAGSLPVKIQSMNLSNSYDGVVSVIEDLTIGTVIDPGLTATGKVHIHLTTDANEEEDLAFTLTVNVVRWNE